MIGDDDKDAKAAKQLTYIIKELKSTEVTSHNTLVAIETKPNKEGKTLKSIVNEIAEKRKDEKEALAVIEKLVDQAALIQITSEKFSSSLDNFEQSGIIDDELMQNLEKHMKAISDGAVLVRAYQNYVTAGSISKESIDLIRSSYKEVDSDLATIFQRNPRYGLLFREIEKNSPPDKQENIGVVIAIVKKETAAMNDKIGKVEEKMPDLMKLSELKEKGTEEEWTAFIKAQQVKLNSGTSIKADILKLALEYRETKIHSQKKIGKSDEKFLEAKSNIYDTLKEMKDKEVAKEERRRQLSQGNKQGVKKENAPEKVSMLNRYGSRKESDASAPLSVAGKKDRVMPKESSDASAPLSVAGKKDRVMPKESSDASAPLGAVGRQKVVSAKDKFENESENKHRPGR